MQARTKIILVLTVLTLAYYVTLPGGKYVLNPSCLPRGLLPKLQEHSHSGEFWAKQLLAVKKEIAAEKATPIAMKKARQEIDKLIQDMVRENPDLFSPRTRAEKLRRMADEIEYREFMVNLIITSRQRVNNLRNCEKFAAKRAKP